MSNRDNTEPQKVRSADGSLSVVRSILEGNLLPTVNDKGDIVNTPSVYHFDQAEAALNAYVEERVTQELGSILNGTEGEHFWDLHNAITKRIAELEKSND